MQAAESMYVLLLNKYSSGGLGELNCEQMGDSKIVALLAFWKYCYLNYQHSTGLRDSFHTIQELSPM